MTGPTAEAGYTLALTGDVIMNTPVSVCRDSDVLAAVELLRSADVTQAHLEIPLHDFDAADVFGAAEGALSWMRGPTSMADELRWLGVDLVSAASNHALDYSYGGLRTTIETLDAAGLAHAGIGADLAAARAPAFVDTPVGRIALISATSSFPTFARAGATRYDAPGRPGVNPQRYLHVVDPATAEQLMATCTRLGMWVVRDGGEFVVHPPGLHNSISRFRIDPNVDGGVDGDVDAPATACDEDDLIGNLEAVRYAASVADLVIAHLHVQAWDGADGRMSSTPAFAREFAHVMATGGAGVVLVQGSHAPMRGIEVHDGVPILYDPGPLFRLGRREVQPHDFYARWGNAAAVSSFDASLLDAFSARDTAVGGPASAKTVVSPREGNSHEPGFVIPICTVDAQTHRVRTVDLFPMSWSKARRATTGFPARVHGSAAHSVLERMAELSKPYGTDVRIDAELGRVRL